jgi:protein tyrosine/serine phosphatase
VVATRSRRRSRRHRPAPPGARVVQVWSGLGGPEKVERVVITRSLATPWARLMAWLDMLVVDHGLVRLVHPNWGEIAPGVFRSAQPTPGQLRRAVRRHGIKTVVNLRAERNCGAFVLEEEACADLGVALVNVRVRSRDVPTKELIWTLERLFHELDKPVLMHCKSGADRTGIVGALYLLLAEGRSLDEATAQLSKRYGHIRQAKTGVLDYVFERYARDHAREPRAFRDWVREVYEPAAVKSDFLARWRGRWFGLDLAFWRE